MNRRELSPRPLRPCDASADYASVDVVQLLLAAGSNPITAGKSGASAADLARLHGFEQLAGLLEIASNKKSQEGCTNMLITLLR